MAHPDDRIVIADGALEFSVQRRPTYQLAARTNIGVKIIDPSFTDGPHI